MKARIAGHITAAVMIAAAVIFPFVRSHTSIPPETLTCRWESGEERVPYSEALASIGGTERGAVVLYREGERGTVAAGEAFDRVRETLLGGSLADLLTVETTGLSPIERAALFTEYKDTAFYDSGTFSFDGFEVSLSDMVWAERVILLHGELAAGVLSSLGAHTLCLRADAELTPSALQGSKIERIVCEAPYAGENGAVLLDTAGGRRLVATLPSSETLSLPACDIIDGGALLPSQHLCSLRTPFVGNTPVRGTSFEGSLGWMFGQSVPASLTSLTVEGGILEAYALMGSALEEVTLCGMDPANISLQALSGVPALRYVHAPRGDLALTGFARSTAPCGCTVYQR